MTATVYDYFLQKVLDYQRHNMPKRSGEMDGFWEELDMPSEKLELGQLVCSFLDRPWYA